MKADHVFILLEDMDVTLFFATDRQAPMGQNDSNDCLVRYPEFACALFADLTVVEVAPDSLVRHENFVCAETAFSQLPAAAFARETIRSDKQASNFDLVTAPIMNDKAVRWITVKGDLYIDEDLLPEKV